MKTDLQVQQDVVAELRNEPLFNSAQITVAVKNGIVTLAGQVSSYAEKWDAERATLQVSGVNALATDISVNLPPSHRRSDSEIFRAAESVLRLTTYLPKDRVHVAVEGGWITLSGDVDREYQRHAANEGVRRLMGVMGICDQIAIKPKVVSRLPEIDIGALAASRATAIAQRVAAAAQVARPAYKSPYIRCF